MNRKKINNTELEIARVNLGGNVFGWTLDEKESFKILDAFVENGGDFIDTADTYPWWVNGTGGLSESIIGKWMKERDFPNTWLSSRYTTWWSGPNTRKSTSHWWRNRD